MKLQWQLSKCTENSLWFLPGKFFISLALGVLHLQGGAIAKSARGVMDTISAAQTHGRVITEFCFSVGSARVFYKMNTTEAPGQLYLYPNDVWPQVISLEDCTQKIKLAQHRVDLIGKEGNFSMLHFDKQTTWRAVYSPENMCNIDPQKMQTVYFQYHIQLFNADSHGVLSNQFSCEDSGPLLPVLFATMVQSSTLLSYFLDGPVNSVVKATCSGPKWPLMKYHTFGCQPGFGTTLTEGRRFGMDMWQGLKKSLLGFYELLAFLYFVIGCMCAPSLLETLKKQGPMHDVLSMLTKVLCLQAFGALCMFVHLNYYSTDGEGSMLAENLAELLEICAQFGMLYMMLSLALGWTLSTSKTEVNSKVWKTSPHAKVVGSLAASQGICIVLEQLFSSSHSMYHSHQSILGILALILRTVLAILFAHYLYQVVSKERSVLRKVFYKSFATYCFVWFLAYPVILLLSIFLVEEMQKRALVFGVTVAQSIAVIKLYRLFLSRSLYWEISALSAASLPLRLDIKNFENKSKK